ncbi:MAG TPA: Hsp33 family molecular chaperone HslO [Xanthomonadaceae bacterium]|nr:Hsp33 family molecular chaperone HslO [Xanthomonadaceae bacterium]
MTEDTDGLSRFLLQRAGVRGVRVHLRDAWQHIRARAAYPPAATALLGEAIAAAALLTAHVKVEGRLSIQLQARRGLRTLFAECTAAGTLRGILRLYEGLDVPRDLRELGEGAVLAITIENPPAGPRDSGRYQGLVGLDTETLASSLQHYFQQSEQLRTRLLLAVDGDRVAGLMLQTLPGDHGDPDGWTRVGALFDTLRPRELLDWPLDTLLQRLFHDEAVQLTGERALRFACTCSRERVLAMLESLGPQEARAAAETGAAEVHCEFCGQAYRLPLEEIEQALRHALMEPPSARLQ